MCAMGCGVMGMVIAYLSSDDLDPRSLCRELELFGFFQFCRYWSRNSRF